MAEENKKNSYTPILVVILIIAAFFLGNMYTKLQSLEGGKTASVTSQISPTPQIPPISPTVGPPAGVAGNIKPVSASDHIRGDKNAKLSLVEYSDLECPFCKRFHPTMQKILENYQDKVRWVYRHFPLDQIHSKADKEAEATECAGELGGNDGFWKMVDKIFEVTPSNNSLNLDDLPKLASQIGLDSGKFKSCLDSGKYAAHVEEDYQDGVKGGISGTPGTIVIDQKGGKQLIPGALPYEQVKQIIDQALKN